jgi:adenosylhomocysteine nucleosidase
MNILVTFALDWEFRPWRKLRAFRQAPDDDRVFHAQIDGHRVQAILTGVGAQNAVRTLRASLHENPDLCVASGLAGGLKRQHRSGDILAACGVRRQPAEEILKSDSRLFNLAVEFGAKAAESFISTSEVVRTSKQKSVLGAFADAVDMESFFVMEEMARLGVPCVAIRSIADGVELNLMCDFDRTLDASGHVRISQVLGQVACSPKELWPLMKFGLVSSRAAAVLTRYLDSYLAGLAAHAEILNRRLQQVAP